MNFDALPEATKAFVDLEVQKAILITDADKYEQYLVTLEEQIKVGVMGLDETTDKETKQLIENVSKFVVDEIIVRVSDKQVE